MVKDHSLDLRSDDRHGEADLVVAADSAIASLVGDLLTTASAETIVAEAFASLGIATTKGSVDDAGALLRTITGQDSDGNETTGECNVQNHAEDGEDADAAEAWGQDGSEDCVQDAHA